MPKWILFPGFAALLVVVAGMVARFPVVERAEPTGATEACARYGSIECCYKPEATVGAQITDTGECRS